jgi:hypothetical protein
MYGVVKSTVRCREGVMEISPIATSKGFGPAL